MSYRDDRQALELQVADLERQNEELREDLIKARENARVARAEDRERRNDSAMRKCIMCGGGALLPVAVFAGRNERSPLPLRMSTMRFMHSGGGFTRAAAILAKACSSCGFIHQFIDMHGEEEEDLRASWSGLYAAATEPEK
ncbi:MAG: hypothetical protein AAF799_48540 [Myxococcota bacterium]